MEDLNLKKKLIKFINLKKTILGVGPMSLNCIDAANIVSNDYKIPMFLICSRRQIDSQSHGGGYVNNWTTEELNSYLKSKKNKYLILSRDHGGPWQNNIEIEKKLNVKEAMKSAKESFDADIYNDFKVIHIDPSLNIDNKNNLSRAIDNIFELYEHCFKFSNKNKKKIIFEIGTEEQTGFSDNFLELENLVSRILVKLKKNRLPKPMFMVAQTGTRVIENKNIGSLDFPDKRIINELPAEITLPKISKMFEKYGIFIKQHNTDYLSNETLKWLPRLGIHAVNVDPEFGYVETLEYVNILKNYNLKKNLEDFYQIAYESKKWEKWIENKNHSIEFKALLCGHYVYSNEKFLESKNEVELFLKKKGFDLNKKLRNKIQDCILNYLKQLNKLN